MDWLGWACHRAQAQFSVRLLLAPPHGRTRNLLCKGVLTPVVVKSGSFSFLRLTGRGTWNFTLQWIFFSFFFAVDFLTPLSSSVVSRGKEGKVRMRTTSQPGVEPGIFWSVVRRVIHCATGPRTWVAGRRTCLHQKLDGGTRPLFGVCSWAWKPRFLG